MMFVVGGLANELWANVIFNCILKTAQSVEKSPKVGQNRSVFDYIIVSESRGLLGHSGGCSDS